MKALNFSKREKEIFLMLAKGKTSKEIAEELHISIHTVDTHRKNLMKKNNVKNTVELVFKALMSSYK